MKSAKPLTHTRESVKYACEHRVSTLLPVNDPPDSGERERAVQYLEHQGQCSSCKMQGKPLPNPGMVVTNDSSRMPGFVR